MILPRRISRRIKLDLRSAFSSTVYLQPTPDPSPKAQILSAGQRGNCDSKTRESPAYIYRGRCDHESSFTRRVTTHFDSSLARCNGQWAGEVLGPPLRRSTHATRACPVYPRSGGFRTI